MAIRFSILLGLLTFGASISLFAQNDCDRIMGLPSHPASVHSPALRLPQEQSPLPVTIRRPPSDLPLLRPYTHPKFGDMWIGDQYGVPLPRGMRTANEVVEFFRGPRIPRENQSTDALTPTQTGLGEADVFGSEVIESRHHELTPDIIELLRLIKGLPRADQGRIDLKGSFGTYLVDWALERRQTKKSLDINNEEIWMDLMMRGMSVGGRWSADDDFWPQFKGLLNSRPLITRKQSAIKHAKQKRDSGDTLQVFHDLGDHSGHLARLEPYQYFKFIPEGSPHPVAAVVHTISLPGRQYVPLGTQKRLLLTASWFDPSGQLTTGLLTARELLSVQPIDPGSLTSIRESYALRDQLFGHLPELQTHVISILKEAGHELRLYSYGSDTSIFANDGHFIESLLRKYRPDIPSHLESLSSFAAFALMPFSEVLAIAQRHGDVLGWIIDAYGNLRFYPHPSSQMGGTIAAGTFGHLMMEGAPLYALGYVGMDQDIPVVYFSQADETIYPHLGYRNSSREYQFKMALSLMEVFYQFTGQIPYVDSEPRDPRELFFVKPRAYRPWYTESLKFFAHHRRGHSFTPPDWKHHPHTSSFTESWPAWSFAHPPFDLSVYRDVCQKQGDLRSDAEIELSWARWILPVTEMTKAEIKSVYYKLVKQVHSDVADKTVPHDVAEAIVKMATLARPILDRHAYQ